MLKNNKKTQVFIILILLIFEVGLIYIYFTNNATNKIQVISKEIPPATDYNRSYYMSQSFYDEAYNLGKKESLTPNNKVYGGIIPHHLMPKNKIASWFIGLEKSDYKTIVLIGPNHYEKGEGDIIISQNRWKTPYGDLLPDTKLGNKLLNNGLTLDEEPFINEHSISGLVPFIKKSFPNAKILPIILKFNTTNENLDNLANLLTSYTTKEDTLVISSVDFSHYQTELVANFHDYLSQNVIENFDFQRIQDLEVDSPASIYTLLKYLEKIGSEKSQMVFHTNSTSLIQQPDEPGTSHFYYYFSQGQSLNNTGISMLFFGDLMLDREIELIIKDKGLNYILKNLARDENRFFMGSDIVSANLESAVTNNSEYYSPEKTYDFTIDPNLLYKLNKDYFFNYFNIANNHLADQGDRGVYETLENLNKINISYEPCTIYIDRCNYTTIEVSNKNIAMLGINITSNPNLDNINEIIKELKNKNDLLVAQIHWGNEYEHNTNKKQQDVAHQLIDYGVDIIIGHHPHVVQGIEVYKNKPIFYSLGNFVFDQYFSKDTQEELSVGIFYSDGEYKIFLLPIKSTNNTLDLMNFDEYKDFLNKITEWSIIDDDLKKQLYSGELSID